MAERSLVPGTVLLHPFPVAALLLVAVNDLVIKAYWPGTLSGKLSDVGICFLLPVVLVSMSEWMTWIGARLTAKPWTPVGPSVHLVACLVAGGYFALLQLSHAWSETHRAMISTLRGGANVVVTPDHTDLVCLVFCVLAFGFLQIWHGSENTRSTI